ncbi:hypothetical protein AB0K60_18605 [Thermopolyspora sp. NPDC052614]|uniref:hypothetical protein n=1 Tax=Thermopolyspora sp. NPDC052614 TaxID=3155682 RepID=UPI0034256A95
MHKARAGDLRAQLKAAELRERAVSAELRNAPARLWPGRRPRPRDRAPRNGRAAVSNRVQQDVQQDGVFRMPPPAWP